MEKKAVRWLMNIIFFGIYFWLFGYIIGRKLPATIFWNIFSLFIIIVINIPLAVFTTEKIFAIIKKE